MSCFAFVYGTLILLAVPIVTAQCLVVSRGRSSDGERSLVVEKNLWWELRPRLTFTVLRKCLPTSE